MSFTIQRMHGESFQVLSVSGYMGNNEYEKLEAELERLLVQGHRRIIVDFTALTFITSASLHRLAKRVRQFRQEGGRIKSCGLPPPAVHLVELARLEKTLNMAADLDGAVRSLSISEALAPKRNRLKPEKEFPRASNDQQTFATEPS